MKDKAAAFRWFGYIITAWAAVYGIGITLMPPAGPYADIFARIDKVLVAILVISGWAFVATGKYLAPDEPEEEEEPDEPAELDPQGDVDDEPGEAELLPDAEPEAPPEPEPLPLPPPEPILKWDLFHVNKATGKRVRFTGNHELTYEVAEQRARVRRMAQLNSKFHSDWTVEAYPVEGVE
jgi:hypothetical protein